MNKDISLSKAAIIAGIGLLIMTLTVPFAEFKIIPDLVNPNDVLETASNITNNSFLFNVAIFLIFITIVSYISRLENNNPMNPMMRKHVKR